jgi:hypothetical protein
MSKHVTILRRIVSNLKITRNDLHFLSSFSVLRTVLHYSSRTKAINAKVKRHVYKSLISQGKRDNPFPLHLEKTFNLK